MALALLLVDCIGLDPGDDVDWVIGLAAAGPRLELAFHHLGLADLGKHFVLRALSSAAEYQAIQTDFAVLGEEERTKLYHARLQHKATTVFLHELGHTLGALHERDAGSIMNPQYDTKTVTFSAETVQLMQLTMQYRRPGERWSGGESWAWGLLDVVQRTQGSWIAADRDDMIARLQQMLATGNPQAQSHHGWNRPHEHRVNRGHAPAWGAHRRGKATRRNVGHARGLYEVLITEALEARLRDLLVSRPTGH